ncbi:MAG TPA: hypothetical protein VG276_05565 [Actinomycetes bacterium]|jgi:predicted lipoprotein with Yx(FWY)xxD motif|nr:hypothetical protein [Actinomycetes bacterium]
MRRTRVGGVATLAALMLLLAACGGTSKEPTSQGQGGQPAATAAPSATATGLKLAQSKLGQVLTDDKGRTLYAFTPDKDGKSTCYGTCAQTWLPLVAQASPVGGGGVSASLLSTTDRTDGSKQTTYKSWPLYYYSGDQQPGDVNGQGVGDKWFVVGADGTLVKKAGSSGGGYGSSGYKG